MKIIQTSLPYSQDDIGPFLLWNPIEVRGFFFFSCIIWLLVITGPIFFHMNISYKEILTL